MKNSYSVIKIEWCIKFIRCILKLLPLQGALLIDIIPRALPWAKSFCPFRACCCGLLDLLGVAAYMGFWAFMALLLWLLITQHALLYGCNYPARPPVWLNLPNTPSCMVELPSTPFCTIEIILHALKGQKLLAQGNALGINDIQLTPCKGKSFTYRRGFSFFIRCILKLLPLQGALLIGIIPRALPWARSFCPFRACCCGLLGLLGDVVVGFLIFWSCFCELLGLRLYLKPANFKRIIQKKERKWWQFEKIIVNLQL